MPQKISPFNEIKYGWDFGESGWNYGMDDNLQKLSYLTTLTIDSVVTSLPSSPSQGDSYYLSTENRIYFYLNGTYNSVPAPKWRTISTKTTGVSYVFDGNSLQEIPSTSSLEQSIGVVQSNLDSFIGDLANPSLETGSSLVAGSVKVVESIEELRQVNKNSLQGAVIVLGYYLSGDGGGGTYNLDPLDTTSVDNGGTVIVGADGGRWKLVHDGKVSIKQFGAKGDWDGVVGADDTSAIQACVVSGVRDIYVPSLPIGLSYQLTSPVIISTEVTIHGAGCSLFRSAQGTRGPGSWFHVNHLGAGFVVASVGGEDARTGCTVKGIGTFRSQGSVTSGWEPVAADYDFKVLNFDCLLEDISLFNPTRGVFHDQGNAGRLTIRRMRGQPLVEGVRVANTYDVFRAEDIHFWPFWSDSSEVRAYTLNNRTDIILERCDNPVINNFFSIFSAVGVRFGATVNGATSKCRISDMDVDIFGQSAIVVESSATSVSAQISNFVCQGADGYQTTGVYVAGNSAKIDVSNFYATSLYRSGVEVVSTGCSIILDGCRISNWNNEIAAYPAIYAAANNRVVISSLPETDDGENGKPYGGGAVFAGMLGRGNITSVNTNASGDVVVTHDLGVTPNQVVLQNITGNARMMGVYNRTSTTFTFRTWRGSDGVTEISVPVSVDWVVYG